MYFKRIGGNSKRKIEHMLDILYGICYNISVIKYTIYAYYIIKDDLKIKE